MTGIKHAGKELYMAKKLNTLLILGATIGAAAAGAYFYLKKQDEAFFDEEDDDDDFDFFEEESESERSYVQLNPGTEKAEEKPAKEADDAAEKPEVKEAVVEEFFDEDDEDEGEAETTSLEDEEA